MKFKKRILRYVLGVDFLLEQWRAENELKKLEFEKKTRERVLEKALFRLGYRLESNIKPHYFEDGQMPDGPVDSFYTLHKLEL